MDEEERTLRTMLRVLGLAAQFVSESETIGVFHTWAVKGHDKVRKGGPCDDPLCAFHDSPEEWQRLMKRAVGMVAGMLM